MEYKYPEVHFNTSFILALILLKDPCRYALWISISCHWIKSVLILSSTIFRKDNFIDFFQRNHTLVNANVCYFDWNHFIYFAQNWEVSTQHKILCSWRNSVLCNQLSSLKEFSILRSVSCGYLNFNWWFICISLEFSHNFSLLLLLLLLSPSVLSNSVRPQRWQPTRLPHPWDSQAKTLEWVAISFSNAWKWKVKVK